MIATGDGTDELDDRDDHAPYPPRDHFGVSAKNLDGQCCGIGTGCIVGDGTEGENDDAETAKTP